MMKTWRSATAEEKQRIIGLKQTRDVCEAAGVGFLVDHIDASKSGENRVLGRCFGAPVKSCRVLFWLWDISTSPWSIGF